MQYVLRSTDVTAEPLVVFDRKFLALAIAGETRVVPAEEAFECLFQPVNGRKEAPKSGKPRANGRRARPAEAEAVAKTGRPAPAQDAILKALADGPRTTAEVYYFIVERLKLTMTKPCTYSTIYALAKRGLVEKREEPESHLDKWFLKKSEGRKKGN
jgi:hypothetical protein